MVRVQVPTALATRDLKRRARAGGHVRLRAALTAAGTFERVAVDGVKGEVLRYRAPRLHSDLVARGLAESGSFSRQ